MTGSSIDHDPGHLRWVTYFMDIAHAVSMKSKDESTKVGAVIVGADNQIVSTGYNGFPRGVQDRPQDAPLPGADDPVSSMYASRFTRPDKYMFTAHAEANAVFQAARHGIRLLGCRIFVSSAPPCCECAKAIIQAGLVGVCCQPPDTTHDSHAFWKHSYDAARMMFREAGVGLWYVYPSYTAGKGAVVEIEEVH